MTYEIYKGTRWESMFAFLIIEAKNSMMFGAMPNGCMVESAYTSVTPRILEEAYMPSNWLELLVLCGISKEQVKSRFKKATGADDE